MKFYSRFVLLPLLLFVGLVHAADMNSLKAKLEKNLPGIKIESLQPVAKTGLVEAVINGDVVYFSADGQYLIQGDVVSLKSRQNLTELKRVSLHKQVLDSLDEKNMIIYSPKNPKYTLTVFTDIDCPYCRKMHSEMAQYNALGIRIRYLAFPRAGLASSSYDKAVDVWCAKDRKQAMNDAIEGKIPKAEKCDNPVKHDYQVGRQLGIQGTPALFLESGQLLPGYVPPKQLKAILDRQASTKS